jgi:cytochrome c oxidase assembly factor CtaG
MSNGGPTQVAGGIIDALKGQPLTLALCVMNVLLVGYLYYAGVVAHDERKTEMQLLYENRSTMAELLFKCVPPDYRPPQSGQH